MDNTLAAVTKFNINDKCLYVKVFWKPNESDLFNIRLYDGEASWSGRYSYEFAKKYAERCNQTKEQYSKTVRRALRKDHNFSYGFTLLPDDKTSGTFSWRKKVQGQDAIVHGGVPIHLENAKMAKPFLLDFLLAENIDLRKTLDAVNLTNAELTASLEKCKRDLDKFVDIKTTLELGLYGKFEQLLNAKKRKMELLSSRNGDAPSNVDNFEEEVQ